MSKHRKLIDEFGELLQGQKLVESDVFEDSKIDRAFVCKVMMHSSDLGSPTKEWRVA